MLKRIPFLFAFNSVLLFTTGVLVYHFLILMEVIPYSNVWGGRLRTQQEMIRFESLSLFINGLFLLVLYLKIRRYRLGASAPAINVVLWLFVAVFSLNTLGNLASFSGLETLVFTPITILLAILTARVAVEE